MSEADAAPGANDAPDGGESGGDEGHRGAEAWTRVTPAGCYAAVARVPGDDDPVRGALLALLSGAHAPPWDAPAHAELARAGLVERAARAESVPAEPLERLLPALLPALSDRGQVVLSESRQGLFLDSAGLSHDDAERLAVTGSGLQALLARDRLLPDPRLGVHSAALAIVDASGHAEVGFWPLHVGRYVFMLTVFGVPRLNTDEFRRLAWTLQQRYGTEAPAPGGGAGIGAAYAGPETPGGDGPAGAGHAS